MFSRTNTEIKWQLSQIWAYPIGKIGHRNLVSVQSACLYKQKWKIMANINITVTDNF